MRIDEALRDEEGFTTAGMAVALLVSLSLLFSAAQVYRIRSLSAEVQEVADAAALAAENQVAEFMIAVRIADAVSLSLTLAGDAAYGLGVVALCVPPAAEVGAQLVSAGRRVLQARDTFSQRAEEALNRVQRALPFLAAANAAAVAAANGEGRAYSYLALAVLLPGDGEAIEIGSSVAEEAMEEAVSEGQGALADAAAKAEEAARAANEAKARGFASDCGTYPDRCLYERAAHLAGLSGDDNPLYTSVDSWSFSVALERARAYYAARMYAEQPTFEDAEEDARCMLRRYFFRYAVSTIRQEGYVHETTDTFEAYFPRMPRNTEQMRDTALYTQPYYPVDVEGELPVMHAWEGCPGHGLTAYCDSVRELESGEYAQCPVCKFSAASLGNIAAATSVIDTGFEYHYNAVAQAAEDYQQARFEGAPAAEEVKDKATDLLDDVSAAFSEASSFRIRATPPGASGCVAVVVSPESSDAGPFEGAFTPGGSLGARAAVAAATLLEDEDDEASVVGDVLDGLVIEGSPLAGAGSLVLGCWSTMLSAYGEGATGLVVGVRNVLNDLPLVGAAGLGTWAADKLRDGISAVGLEPADLAPLKPVLASSAGVARASGGAYAERFLALREQVLANPDESSDGLSLLGGSLGREAFDALSGYEVEIARIEVPVIGIDVPITITLPDAVAEGASGLVERAIGALGSVVPSEGRADPWE